MSGAYIVNGQQVEPEAFYAVACDPRRSVVVEACAGAGKTWMLVSRMLRAMIDGTPPHQILAITFTRKAAGEMRSRLQEWMHEFAHADDAACDEALRQRGVAEADVPAMRDRLRGLQAAWMADGRGVEIHTILGWFAKLVQGAPMDLLHELGLPPDLQLIENTDALWPTLWGRFLRKVDGDAELKALLMVSIDHVGRHNTEAWLMQALSHRLEIELAEQHGRLRASVEDLSFMGPAWSGDEPLQGAWRRPVVLDQLWALARELGTGSKKTQQSAGMALERVLTLALETDNDAAAAHGIREVLFTAKGELRKAFDDTETLQWVVRWLQDWGDAQAQQDAHQQHERQCRLALALLDQYRQLKAELGVADMADLELAASRLMADPVMSGWVQERLDHQVRHVLMDEFQDTSPLQWHTLKAWLSAYAGAGGGSSGQQAPSVFLVGDPKQSIYRFRRADPRVFQAARRFVVDALDGEHLACDHTRRNAQAVIAALNAVMGKVAEAGRFPDFRPHSSASPEAGEVRALPQVRRDGGEPESTESTEPHADQALLPEGWRDSLRTPRHTVEASRREREAEQIATLIQHLMRDESVQADEVFVLARRRVSLEAVAQVLSLRQVPHIAPESDLLTDKQEVQDLMAALEALLSPAHNLALAQALRSPLFGATDDDLLALSARMAGPQPQTGQPGQVGSWMQALLAWPETLAMPDALARAAVCFRAWQACLPHLPPHDLLERMVRDTDLRTSLARVVPDGQWQAALFHIDTLMAHSLAANAGRDLTPYRWLRQLRRDPPKLPPRATRQAVQLLTVHGAKGLEAEVVILADMDAEPARSSTYGLMIDWPEGEAAPMRCAFVASESRCPPSLRALRDAEAQAADIEAMNALYVAMTRARRTLVFSSTQPRAAQAESWWGWMHNAGVCPEPMDVPAMEEAGQAHAVEALPACVRLPVLPALPDLPALAETSVRPAANDAEGLEAALGEWVHAALERLTLMPDASRNAVRIDQVLQATQAAVAARPELSPHTDWDALLGKARHLVVHMLNAAALKPWLTAHGWAWSGNEVPLADAQGAMRLDRLVARLAPDGRMTWWVMDHKLNHDPLANEAYQRQMARYVAAVQKAQPGDRVGGAFITAQGLWQVWSEPSA